MKNHWWHPFLIPFTLLTYVVTLLVAVPFYRPTKVRLRAGCIEMLAGTRIWGQPGGQSWGIRVIWYRNESQWDRADLRVHERVHILQGEMINALAHLLLVPIGIYHGPGWVIAAVLLSQAAFALAYFGHFLFEWRHERFQRKNWHPAYLRTWAERMAYRIQAEFKDGQRPQAWGA